MRYSLFKKCDIEAMKIEVMRQSGFDFSDKIRGDKSKFWVSEPQKEKGERKWTKFILWDWRSSRITG